MNVLSLFDGMSCGQLALQRAGIKVENYYAVEIDKYAIKVTQANFPDTVQLGSVTDVNFANKGWWDNELLIDFETNEHKGTITEIDLLIGGSPCQGFSFAGKQLNFDDPRSKLFFEFVRILKEVKPTYFLLENVKMKQEYQDIISEHLGVKPIEINSNLVSAQNRKRLYWTNIPDVTQPEDKGILLEDILEDGDTVIDAIYNNRPERVYKEKSPTIRAGRQGLEVRRKSKCVRSGGRGSYDRHEWDSIDNNHTRKLTVLECERLQTVPDNYTNHVSNTQRYKMLGNGWTIEVIAHILKGINTTL